MDKIKRDGLKGTRKYKAANKIQALFRGYSFRVKRKRLLAKLSQNPGKGGEFDDDLGMDPLLGDDDFDAEAFLNVKQENLEQADIFSGANASLMEKYIQVLSYEQKQKATASNLPPTGFNHPGRRQVAPPLQAAANLTVQQSPMRKNSQLPPISPIPGGGSTVSGSAKRDLSKPKSYQMMT